jgi:drug/metabolite transporter (DMT)-like permease
MRIYFILAAGLAMFAFAPIVVRLAGGDADPVAITTIRTVSAFFLLMPVWIWYRYREWHQTKQQRRDGYNHDGVQPIETIVRSRSEVAWSAVAGVFLSMHFMLWIGSLFFTSVASASVLVTIHPIMLIIAETVFLKKRFGMLSWIGVAIAFGGSIVLAFGDGASGEQYLNPLLGNAMAFTAAIMFVFYILISQKIRKQTSWIDYVFMVYGFTAVGSVLISLVMGVTWWDQPLPTILSGLGLAIGAQLIGHGAMNYAVKYISATLLSTLILAEPVFATILAVLFFAEVPGMISVLAMGIVMSGIFLTWWARRNIVAEATSA